MLLLFWAQCQFKLLYIWIQFANNCTICFVMYNESWFLIYFMSTKKIKVSYGVCPRVNIRVHIRWMSLVTLICQMYNKHLPDYQYIRSWKINRHGFRFVLYLDIGKNVYQGSSEQGKVLSPVSLALFCGDFNL